MNKKSISIFPVKIDYDKIANTRHLVNQDNSLRSTLITANKLVSIIIAPDNNIGCSIGDYFYMVDETSGVTMTSIPEAGVNSYGFCWDLLFFIYEVSSNSMSDRYTFFRHIPFNGVFIEMIQHEIKTTFDLYAKDFFINVEKVFADRYVPIHKKHMEIFLV